MGIQNPIFHNRTQPSNPLLILSQANIFGIRHVAQGRELFKYINTQVAEPIDVAKSIGKLDLIRNEHGYTITESFLISMNICILVSITKPDLIMCRGGQIRQYKENKLKREQTRKGLRK